MNILRKLKNYFFYCGIEKEEYNKLKKDAYISNFKVWRILHFVMTAVFFFLYVGSLFNEMMKTNSTFYLLALIYSAFVSFLFLNLRSDSLVAQLIIYLSISLLLLFGCLITQNKPDNNASTFFVLLVITPMFMIDKPFFMTIELSVAAAIFSIWMYNVKSYNIWEMDFANVITFTVVGVFLHIIANSIRIKEFVLTREINIQKDTDELTGIKNKGALTRGINEFLKDSSTNKGAMFLLDIDHFKSINDTYGHDVGDSVIIQFAKLLAERFTNDEIVGRFGGDEFIVFIKNTDNFETICGLASDVINRASEIIKLPDKDRQIRVSIGISIYKGLEKNYSEIFKKADVALYNAKADQEKQFCLYE